MPKVLSKDERKQTLDAIYRKTIGLIRSKGIRKVTVDDITTAVGISKGAFYRYYPSKEIGIYEVLKHSERDLFTRMESLMAEKMETREQIERFLREVLLAPDSVILYISPTDIEILLRKLPPEYRERENEKSINYFQKSFNIMGIAKSKMEVLALLTDCLSVIATNSLFSESGKKQAIDVLVNSMTEYMLSENKGEL